MLLIVSFNFVCFTFSATPEREQQKAQARPWTEIFSLIELYLLHLSHKPACGLISLAEEDSLRSSMGVYIWMFNSQLSNCLDIIIVSMPW